MVISIILIADFSYKELENQRKLNSDKANLTYTAVKKMKPQVSLDLHGSTVAEAEIKIISFLEKSKRLGHIKVQIIHGKGLHSENGEGVLSAVVYNLLSNCHIAGRIGTLKERDGGCGATWVILK